MPKEPPRLVTALPATGWVAERLESDGSRSVVPLVGWAVFSDGEIRPLPLSLSSDWSIRPAMEGDDRLARTTVARTNGSHA